MLQILGTNDQADDRFFVFERSEWDNDKRKKVLLARQMERNRVPRKRIREIVNYPPTMWWKVSMNVTNLTIAATIRQSARKHDFSKQGGVLIDPRATSIPIPTDQGCTLEWVYTVTDGSLGWSFDNLFFEVQFQTNHRRTMIVEGQGGSGDATGKIVMQRRFGFPTPQGWPPFLYADPLFTTQEQYAAARVKADTLLKSHQKSNGAATVT